MTTSQFERIPVYNPAYQSICSPPQGPWESSITSPSLPLTDLLQGEFVIANGHSISPLSTSTSVDSDRDLPDTPGYLTQPSFDVVDIKKTPPELIAAQLTLIDLEIFKAIGMEEFSNCNWTKKDKQRLAPNIVAFTSRFNHTSFLVVREILNEENEKARAESISQFIKLAKKLFELNNLHSMKAVVSALQSTPIYRLHQTWKHVSKKDKGSFEKLEEFLSDNENRRVLREHMDAAKLPCIPHLGLYLTDLCFLQDIPNKGSQTESTLNMIAYCQNSTYDAITVEPHVRKYLTHVRYIDELQKFFEDDNYKLSLKYEPSLTPQPRKRHTAHAITPLSTKSTLRTSKSHEDLLTQLAAEGLGSADNQRNSFMRRSFNTSSKSGHRNSGQRNMLGGDLSALKLSKQQLSVPSLGEPPRERFASASVEVTRKTTTLPNNLREADLLAPFADSKPRSASDWLASSGRHGDGRDTSSLGGGGTSPPGSQRQFPHSPLSGHSRPKKEARGHKKSHSLGSNVLASMFGVSNKPAPLDIRSNLSPEPQLPTSLSLLDDSLLDDTFTFTPTGSIGNASTSGGSSHASLDEFFEGDQLYRHSEDADELANRWDVIKEGFLKKKILRQNGITISQLRGRSKCWVRLNSSSIEFMEAKPKRRKKQSKPLKTAHVMLKACQLKHRDPSEKLTDEQFIINDDNGNSTRFTAKSVPAAMEWVVSIKEAIRVEEETEREEAERSLIKL